MKSRYGTRKDLRVEGRVSGDEYSEIIMTENGPGIYRLDSPTHPAFWAKIVTPFATQRTEEIIYQLLKRNQDQGYPFLDPRTIMKSFARFYLDQWESNPESLIEHLDEWSDGFETTEALHWPIFSSDTANSPDSLVGLDKRFYQTLVKGGGLNKYSVTFECLEEQEIVTNWPALYLSDGGTSTNVFSCDDWQQFDTILPNNNYALVLKPLQN